MWNPFKMLRTRIGKRSRLYIFGLVIQDHIESIGKPILLKGDEVLLNGLFAQVLSDSAPKPSTTMAPRMHTTVVRRSPHIPAQEITMACAFTTSIMNTGISINGYANLT